MTAIIGIVDKHKIYMGCDSAVVSESNLNICNYNDKIFRKGDLLIGFSGSLRMGQILKHGLKLVKQKNKSDDEYINTVVINSIQMLMRKNGHAKTIDGEERIDGTILIGFKNALWQIDEDFSVVQNLVCDAIGCGDNICLGVLHATEGMDPQKRILMALEASEKYNASVRRPFKIFTTP